MVSRGPGKASLLAARGSGRRNRRDILEARIRPLRDATAVRFRDAPGRTSTVLEACWCRSRKGHLTFGVPIVGVPSVAWPSAARPCPRVVGRGYARGAFGLGMGRPLTQPCWKQHQEPVRATKNAFTKGYFRTPRPGIGCRKRRHNPVRVTRTVLLGQAPRRLPRAFPLIKGNGGVAVCLGGGRGEPHRSSPTHA